MTSMPDYGPRGAQVAAFIADLAARDDQALWELEEAIGENLTIGSHGSPWSTPGPDGRSGPSTRPAAVTSGRLLAWYEAGHYALLAVAPRDDGSVRMEVPGQASTVSLPHLAHLAPSIAQALVVRDQLTTNTFLEAIAGWPEVIEGHLVERLDDATRLPNKASGTVGKWVLDPFAAAAARDTCDMSAVEIDDLTGVLNYREQSRMRIGSVVAVADLLHFRDRINDPYGHDVGDRVLREIGTRLRMGLAPHRVYRHAGDEFAVEVEGGLDANGAHRLAQRIAELVGAPLPGIGVLLEVHVGVCLRPVDSGNIQDVLMMASDAAYRAACFDLGVAVYAP